MCTNEDEEFWGDIGRDNREAGVGEEGEPALAKVVPCRPCLADVDEQNLTHIPFRSWCDHCVRGRTVSEPHHISGMKKFGKPLIAKDYMNLKGKYDVSSEAEDQVEARRKPGGRHINDMPILATRDRDTHLKFAHAVPVKGDNEYVTARVVLYIREPGHSEVFAKCVREPAILALRNGVCDQSDIKILDEEPPV